MSNHETSSVEPDAFKEQMHDASREEAPAAEQMHDAAAEPEAEETKE
jgi:hypothetical protein